MLEMKKNSEENLLFYTIDENQNNMEDKWKGKQNDKWIYHEKKIDKKYMYKIDVKLGDRIKFRNNYLIEKNDYKPDFLNSIKKPFIYYGIVIDISKPYIIGVRIATVDLNSDITEDYSVDVLQDYTFYTEKKNILQIYEQEIIEHLTPRLALKHLWKNFVFREIKTVKPQNLLHIEYKYINKFGLERSEIFRSLEEAKENVPMEHRKNIYSHYEDFYGFTFNTPIIDKDKYADHEIFFSKKCYSELDWSNNPTGDFLLHQIGGDNIPPEDGTLICGLVENGEKGLFYRKWFFCSPQFLKLWKIICLSAQENSVPSNFDNFLNSLDTSEYGGNIFLNTKNINGINSTKNKKKLFYNIEKTAIYFPNKYKEIATALFNRPHSGVENYFIDNNFIQRLLYNLMWPSRI